MWFYCINSILFLDETLVLFIMEHKVILSFTSVNETLDCDHSKKAIEQYFHVALFTVHYKVVLMFTSLDETLVSDHSF